MDLLGPLTFGCSGPFCMAKLKTLPSRIKPAAPRIGFAEGDQRGAERSRNRAAPWRAWYSTSQWQELRLATFIADGFMCRRCGASVMGKGQANCDHVSPHRGDRTRFFDPANLQTLCTPCHSGAKQREEQSIPTGVWD